MSEINKFDGSENIDNNQFPEENNNNSLNENKGFNNFGNSTQDDIPVTERRNASIADENIFSDNSGQQLHKCAKTEYIAGNDNSYRNSENPAVHRDSTEAYGSVKAPSDYRPINNYENYGNTQQSSQFVKPSAAENEVPRAEKYADIPPASRESCGIRYNADRSGDGGSYTWQYYRGDMPVRSEPVKKKHTALKTVLLSVSSALAVALIGFMAFFILTKSGSNKNGIEDLPPSVSHKDSGYENDGPIIGHKKQDNSDNGSVFVVPDEQGGLSKQMIAVKCKPSSVGIEVSATTYSYFGTYKSSGVGSGFILTEDGYIATNNHVVSGAEEITVMLDDGTKYPAKVIGTDSVTDLAVVKIDAKGLVPMEIGDSDLMQVGDSVVAIGTPAGIEFAGTVTDGIISAINRDVEVQSSSGHTKTMTLMQTNAAINPGNSGGPLINDKGQVIGINTLKLTEKYEGIGFSIPINSAVSIFNQLIKDGRVTDYDQSFVTGTGSIGITKYEEITAEEAEYYGIPRGIIIIQLDVTSSAQKAGLRRGDIITAFNGTEVKTVAELNKLKSKFKSGDEVTLTVYRDPKEVIDITFKLDVMG